MLYSWARRFTLTVLLSTQVYDNKVQSNFDNLDSWGLGLIFQIIENMNINEPDDLIPGYLTTNIPQTHILIQQKSMEKLFNKEIHDNKYQKKIIHMSKLVETMFIPNKALKMWVRLGCSISVLTVS